jgi:altronate hydrolase
VFCENRNLEFIKDAMERELGYGKTDKYRAYTHQLLGSILGGQTSEFKEETVNSRVFKNIDGVKFLFHQGGCGGTRQDSTVLAKLLAGYMNHGNVCGITVMSLGCQHLQVEELKEHLYAQNPAFDKPLFVFEQQESKSEEDLLKEAIAITMKTMAEINATESRKPAPLSKLILGVKCGGSDGFSGISANPSVGYAADLLVGLGGSVVLAEFPELNGVEQELADRSATPEVADKFINLMRAYSAQAEAAGSGFYANPSPGNIKDGLITDAIKSAGAAKKGGTAPVADVLDYTEQVTKPGLNLLCTPGNDVEATTGKAGSGANLILFTTGLGTPTGNPVCPVIKVATNSKLAQKMADIIDIDTGSIITGEDTIETMGEKILDFCIEVASGNITPKAVALQQDDFIPWKRGVSL